MGKNNVKKYKSILFKLHNHLLESHTPRCTQFCTGSRSWFLGQTCRQCDTSSRTWCCTLVCWSAWPPAPPHPCTPAWWRGDTGPLVIGVSREVVDELVRKVDVTGSW